MLKGGTTCLVRNVFLSTVVVLPVFIGNTIVRNTYFCPRNFPCIAFIFPCTLICFVVCGLLRMSPCSRDTCIILVCLTNLFVTTSFLPLCFSQLTFLFFFNVPPYVSHSLWNDGTGKSYYKEFHLRVVGSDHTPHFIRSLYKFNNTNDSRKNRRVLQGIHYRVTP